MRQVITTANYLQFANLMEEDEAARVAFGVLVDEFSAQMKQVFNEKVEEGKQGWDSPYNLHQIKDLLKAKVDKIMDSMHTAEDLVDISNLAAMVYNMIAPSECDNLSTE